MAVDIVLSMNLCLGIHNTGGKPVRLYIQRHLIACKTSLTLLNLTVNTLIYMQFMHGKRHSLSIVGRAQDFTLQGA